MWYFDPALPRSVGLGPVSSPPFSTAPPLRRYSPATSPAARPATARRGPVGAGGPRHRLPATRAAGARRCAQIRSPVARAGLASGSRCRARTRSLPVRRGPRSAVAHPVHAHWSWRDQWLHQLPKPVSDQPLLLRSRHDRDDQPTATEDHAATHHVLRPGLSRIPVSNRSQRSMPDSTTPAPHLPWSCTVVDSPAGKSRSPATAPPSQAASTDPVSRRRGPQRDHPVACGCPKLCTRPLTCCYAASHRPA